MPSFIQHAYHLVTTEIVFVFFSTLVNTFFVLYFIGFFKNKNVWIDKITLYLQVFVAGFLIFKFHPFLKSEKKCSFTSLDRKVAFSAGFYLLAIYGIQLYQRTFAIVTEVKKELGSEIQTVPLSGSTTMDILSV